ncbi:hypothetical protein GCM10009641_47070 [Mycobacterium cookii]|uniref:Uncharacterized protein n=1 Tax=Nocardioides furvisabuli TaxID=375542 RepID=A0ABP5JHD0_9ACTN
MAALIDRLAVLVDGDEVLVWLVVEAPQAACDCRLGLGTFVCLLKDVVLKPGPDWPPTCSGSADVRMV